MYARSLGFNVSFVVRNEFKKNFLSQLEFDCFFSEKSGFSIKFDTVIECVGSVASILDSIRYAKQRGEIVLIGNPTSNVDILKNLYWKILRSELTIKGVWNSKFKNKVRDDWDKAIEFLYNNQSIVSTLITDRFTLENCEKAFRLMKSSGNHIKTMFFMD